MPSLSLSDRESEALGLRWTDFDLESGTLNVRWQLQYVDPKRVPAEIRTKLTYLHGNYTLTESKSEKGRRTIALPAVTLSALMKHKERQEGERALAGSKWVELDLVFTTPKGTPINQRTLLKDYYATVKAAQVRRVRFHDLRHTAASLLLAQRVALKAVQDILGHSDIRLTPNFYSHLFPGVRREIAARMDAILNPVAAGIAANIGELTHKCLKGMEPPAGIEPATC